MESAANQACARLEARRAHQRRPLRTVWPRRAAQQIPHDNMRSLMRDNLTERWRTSRLGCRVDLENIARRRPSCDCRLKLGIDRKLQAGDSWVPPDSCEGHQMRATYFRDSTIFERSDIRLHAVDIGSISRRQLSRPTIPCWERRPLSLQNPNRCKCHSGISKRCPPRIASL